MNTPKRLLSGSDDPSDYTAPSTRRRSRSPNESSSTPIDHQIEQVARRHRVPSDTVKRILSDLLSEQTVIDYLRTNFNQAGSSTGNESHHDESLLSSTSLFDSPPQRSLASSQINTNPSPSLFSPTQQPNLLSTANMVDEYDPLWLEFIQSLNKTEMDTDLPPNTTQSTVTFDSLLNDDDDDDEEFIGPEDEIHTDQKKLRVSKRELALLLKDSTASPDELPSHSNEELLPADQYESLWTDFLASLQQENRHHPADEQPKSIVTSTTEEDENDDDPEFRLPDNHYDLDDDLDEELHVSKRELALLLEDNASLLNTDEHAASEELANPESVSSTATSTVARSSLEHHHQLTREQRDILQYQLSAYVQLLTQYILLRRETDPSSFNGQSAQQLFKDLLYFRDQQANSILAIPLLAEAQRLLESPPPSSRRKALGNHLPFHLMDTFCKSPSFAHETLLPTCLLSSKSNLSSFIHDQNRNFVSGEDCLMALGLEQNDVNLLIVGHGDKSIRDRLDSLRYARVRRGKQNPIKSFFTYGSMSDVSLDPWYHLPHSLDLRQIYPNGLIQKDNVVFPPWFRLSYKRSRQLSRREQASLLPSATPHPTTDTSEVPSSSTVYVVVEGTSSTARSTSPKKVLQQIHMLHLLNSYPKLQPKQRGT